MRDRVRIVIGVAAHQGYEPERLLHGALDVLLEYGLQGLGEGLEVPGLCLDESVELMLDVPLAVPFLKIRRAQDQYRLGFEGVAEQRPAVLPVGVHNVEFRATVHEFPTSAADVPVGSLKLA